MVKAISLVVTANQVNAIMPSNAPLGKVAIQVIYNGTASNTTAAAQPALEFLR